jgi:hypothetical protein
MGGFAGPMPLLTPLARPLLVL